MEAGAIPALIEVVEQAQPDGQYAAAAALYNLAGRDREVRLAIMRSNAVPALVQMLHADSWYGTSNHDVSLMRWPHLNAAVGTAAQQMLSSGSAVMVLLRKSTWCPSLDGEGMAKQTRQHTQLVYTQEIRPCSAFCIHIALCPFAQHSVCQLMSGQEGLSCTDLAVET